jgi:hypothetical protein
MTGEKLHEYDLDLCEYILGNIQKYECYRHFWGNLCKLLEDSKESKLGEYLAHGKIHTKIFGKKKTLEDVQLVLNEDQLEILNNAVEGANGRFPWEPYEALHNRFDETVPEVRASLGVVVANRWAEVCEQHGKRLERGVLHLIEGIETG